MRVDRDAAAIVAHQHPVGGHELELDPAGVARHRLVHGVVQHLGHEMVQRPLVGAADIHAGPPPHRLQPLQHLDVVRGIVPFAAALPWQIERQLVHRYPCRRAASPSLNVATMFTLAHVRRQDHARSPTPRPGRPHARHAGRHQPVRRHLRRLGAGADGHRRRHGRRRARPGPRRHRGRGRHDLPQAGLRRRPLQLLRRGDAGRPDLDHHPGRGLGAAQRGRTRR